MEKKYYITFLKNSKKRPEYPQKINFRHRKKKTRSKSCTYYSSSQKVQIFQKEGKEYGKSINNGTANIHRTKRPH